MIPARGAPRIASPFRWIHSESVTSSPSRSAVSILTPSPPWTVTGNSTVPLTCRSTILRRYVPGRKVRTSPGCRDEIRPAGLSSGRSTYSFAGRLDTGSRNTSNVRHGKNAWDVRVA